ncbi:unnamed protein product [Meganyctiphanes norvegica]|uniref:NADH dehydrogenase subunit 4L n=1 Tax=Meganyctiphanes norvegica TaxID=48144 RepID=A0AAV2SJX2_MEGNR
MPMVVIMVVRVVLVLVFFFWHGVCGSSGRDCDFEDNDGANVNCDGNDCGNCSKGGVDTGGAVVMLTVVVVLELLMVVVVVVVEVMVVDVVVSNLEAARRW